VKEPNWEPRLMPATTQFENTEEIVKVVGFLPVVEAMRLP
jgi:hypothetical protein